MIEIILSHESALAYWSNPTVPHAAKGMSEELVSEILDSTPSAISCKSIKALRHSYCPDFLPTPLHLLVSEPSKRRNLKEAQFHCECRSLPKGSFVPVGNHQFYRDGDLYDLACASPELMYAQIAPLFEFLELLELGYELCGEYSLCGSKRTMMDRPSVTSACGLKEYLDTLPAIRGSKQASKAAKYVLDNSWSPKETQIAIMLTLPRSMGGFGIERPLLNYEIKASSDAKAVLKGDRLIPDMYWPSMRTVLEYDSNDCHDDLQAIDHDARKRSAYAIMGLNVVSVTYDQLREFSSFAPLAEYVATKFAKQAGTRRQATTPEQKNKQLRIHNWLMYGQRKPRPDVSLQEHSRYAHFQR